MAFKNYYMVLGVAPNATEDEIKKKFRRLALQYHPDRNPGNEWVVTRFREIQEAYQILCDTNRRILYNREWRQQFPQAKLTVVKEISPEGILEDMIRLKKQVQTMDPYRLNKQSVEMELHEIMNENNITLLAYHNNIQVNKQVAEYTLDIAALLSPGSQQLLQQQLLKLATSNNDIALQVKQAQKRHFYKNIWERYYPLLAFALAAAACIAIYYLSN